MFLAFYSPDPFFLGGGGRWVNNSTDAECLPYMWLTSSKPYTPQGRLSRCSWTLPGITPECRTKISLSTAEIPGQTTIKNLQSTANKCTLPGHHNNKRAEKGRKFSLGWVIVYEHVLSERNNARALRIWMIICHEHKEGIRVSKSVATYCPFNGLCYVFMTVVHTMHQKLLHSFSTLILVTEEAFALV